jgi:hypothetical protein
LFSIMAREAAPEDEARAQVDLVHRVPGLVAHLHQGVGLAPRRARAVHQHVDAAEARDGVLDQPLGGAAPRQVDLGELGRAARFLHRGERGRAARRVDLGQEQARAFAREAERQRAADAVARAGDERGFVLE